MPSIDSFKTRQDLSVGRKKYAYYSLPAAEEAGLAGISRLPRSMKVLLENLLRNEDGRSVTRKSIEAVAAWMVDRGKAGVEIAYRPARVLMQDFTGVPAVVDLAAMRDGINFFRSPTEVVAEPPAVDEVFRIGGLVEAGFGLVATMISIAISAAAYRQLATTQAGDIFA